MHHEVVAAAVTQAGSVLGAILALVAAVVAVAMGATLGWGIVITALSPVIVVVGYETVGYRHQADALGRALT